MLEKMLKDKKRYLIWRLEHMGVNPLIGYGLRLNVHIGQEDDEGDKHGPPTYPP